MFQGWLVGEQRTERRMKRKMALLVSLSVVLMMMMVWGDNPSSIFSLAFLRATPKLTKRLEQANK